MTEQRDMTLILSKLEDLEDQELAARLLGELTAKTKELGTLVMNLNPELGHAEWKAQCDLLKEEVDLILKKIDNA